MGTGLLVLSTLGQAGSAVGQQTPAQENLQLLAETGEQLQNVLGQDAEKRLSTGGQRLMTLADQADELSAVLGASGGAAASITAAGSVLPSRAGSDPFAREDFVSRFAGAFQAGTSVARCGDNVVLGFTDTGSQMATLFLGASPSGSQSFTGWSTSSDGGVSYIDRGALVADPLPRRYPVPQPAR
jgi:hypothetical protein